jgi:hypothetical protein
MNDWFLTRYNREELAEFVINHPQWSNQDVDRSLGRAALAALLENLDNQINRKK